MAVNSLEHLGSNEYWRYYDYEKSDCDSDTRSSYSIASLTFQVVITKCIGAMKIQSNPHFGYKIDILRDIV